MFSLCAQALHKFYGERHAVNAVSFSLKSGQILALLGPNGAGKSSLIRMLTGLTKPDQGQLSYQYQQQQLAQLPASLFGYLPEDRGLYQDISLQQNLEYIASLRGLRMTDARPRISQWLSRFELAGREQQKLSSLSKGNQQKVQLIATLIHQPALVVLDEPFSGLDPLNQELVLQVLAELRDVGCAVLLSAHQMALVERLADQFLLLDQGAVIASGNLAQTRAQLGQQRGFLAEFTQAPNPALQQNPTWQLQARCERSYQLQPLAEVSFADLVQTLSQYGELQQLSVQDADLHQLYLQALRTRRPEAA